MQSLTASGRVVRRRADKAESAEPYSPMSLAVVMTLWGREPQPFLGAAS